MFIVGVVVDTTGSYNGAFILSAVSTSIASILVFICYVLNRRYIPANKPRDDFTNISTNDRTNRSTDDSIHKSTDDDTNKTINSTDDLTNKPTYDSTNRSRDIIPVETSN